jgi:peptidylprolyl isomerase
VKYNRIFPAMFLTAVVAVSLFSLAACQPKGKKATTVRSSAETQIAISGTQAESQVPFVLPGAITTQDGLQYLEETAGDGPNPAPGDVIVMNYIVSLPDGTEIYNTYTNYQASTAVVGRDQLLPGWEEGVRLMKPGGKAKLVLPPELAFGDLGNGVIPPNSQVILEVELISVQAPPEPVSVTPDQLKSLGEGEQYYDITVGGGAEAISGTTVTTAYTIWVVGPASNDFIRSSSATQPATFEIGQGNGVFEGWERGVLGMKVGGERLLIIPPDLALGAQGDGVIPPDATLLMQIKLVKVETLRTPTFVDINDYVALRYGIAYYDIRVGDGITPTVGSTIVVNYVGWLTDGTQFDSSYNRGTPFSYVYGKGNVIPGWDLGIASMRVGGKRQIVIRPEYAYGDTGMGGSITVPPGAILIMEVELLEVKP